MPQKKTLFVHGIDGNVYTIRLEHEDTITILEEKLFELTGIPAISQKLFTGRNLLANDEDHLVEKSTSQ